jgi:hypothetical protein
MARAPALATVLAMALVPAMATVRVLALATVRVLALATAMGFTTDTAIRIAGLTAGAAEANHQHRECSKARLARAFVVSGFFLKAGITP